MVSNQSFSSQSHQNPQATGVQPGQTSGDVHLPSASAPIQSPQSIGSEQQLQPNSSSKTGNATFNRVLIGGLIGGTLGSIAAALASRKTAEGFNRAAEGTKSAFKTIGMGLGQTAKGVGDAAKSIGGGIGYAIVGNVQESAESITQGAQQIGDATAAAVQSTSDVLNQAGQTVSGQVGAAAQSFSQSAQSSQPSQSSMASGSQVTGGMEQSQQSDLPSAQGESDLIAAVILSAIEEDVSVQGEPPLPDMIILQEETPQILLQDNPFSDVEAPSTGEYLGE